MKHLRTTSLGLFLLFFLLPACQTIADFYQAGEYDKAFKAAQHRAGGKCKTGFFESEY